MDVGVDQESNIVSPSLDASSLSKPLVKTTSTAETEAAAEANAATSTAAAAAAASTPPLMVEGEFLYTVYDLATKDDVERMQKEIAELRKQTNKMEALLQLINDKIY